MFLKQLKSFSNQLSRQLFIYFQIQIEPNSTTYICTSCLHNISENKPPLYQVSNNFFRNKIIPLVQKLTQLKEHIISPHLTFAQIYELQGYGQYKIHANVINGWMWMWMYGHGLLWIKNAPMYGVHINEEIEKFINMYISCDISLLPNPLQNAQQDQHTYV
jgi:hypothetical protein